MSPAAGTIWLTGLSGAGKTTIGNAIREELGRRNIASVLIDGDSLRTGVSTDLGFSKADRDENVRRASEIAKLVTESGVVAVVAMISPHAASRAEAKQRHDNAAIPFIEVFVDTPLSVCESRDPKALYARARNGGVKQFTGITDAYEEPTDPDVLINGATTDPDQAALKVIPEFLRRCS